MIVKSFTIRGDVIPPISVKDFTFLKAASSFTKAPARFVSEPVASICTSSTEFKVSTMKSVAALS